MLTSLFGKRKSSPLLVRDMRDLRPYLIQKSIVFEDRPALQILGVDMERVRIRRGGAIAAIGFGGGFFHIVHILGLKRSLLQKEIVDFNASVQMFSLTPSDAPPAAIIKTHYAAHYGASPQTLLSLLAYSSDAADTLVNNIGAETLRDL